MRRGASVRSVGIRVVTSASAARHGFKPWRVARAILGWLFVLGGLLVAVPILGLILAAFLLSASPDRRLGTMLFYLAVAVVSVSIGRRLIRGKRQLVLFLRRFGFRGSSRALSFAVSTAVGRRFRVVTLDDAELAPVGTRRGVGWLLAAASLVSLFLLVFIVREFARWFLGDALGNVFTEAFENARNAAIGSGENLFGAFLAGLFGAFFVTLIFGMLAGGLIVLYFAVFGSAAAVSVSSYLGVIRTELVKRTKVQRRSELERVTGDVARRARRIFAPRLVVLSAAGSVWRETVLQLAGFADILLIDVSVPSENLLWEISTLRPDHGSRWILIGESERIAELVEEPGATAQTDAGRLAELLDGEAVLTYTTGSRKTLRHFARALRARCESVRYRAA